MDNFFTLRLKLPTFLNQINNNDNIFFTHFLRHYPGKSERYSRDLIRKIKKELNKSEHQVLTVEEFSSYMGIPCQSIWELIN